MHKWKWANIIYFLFFFFSSPTRNKVIDASEKVINFDYFKFFVESAGVTPAPAATLLFTLWRLVELNVLNQAGLQHHMSTICMDYLIIRTDLSPFADLLRRPILDNHVFSNLYIWRYFGSKSYILGAWNHRSMIGYGNIRYKIRIGSI